MTFTLQADLVQTLEACLEDGLAQSVFQNGQHSKVAKKGKESVNASVLIYQLQGPTNHGYATPVIKLSCTMSLKKHNPLLLTEIHK